MPTRLIDIPIESLPRIDEHSVSVAASPEETWSALLRAVDRFAAGRSAAVARALGCAQTEHTGPPARIGSTVPGFVVTRSIPPAVLALMGEHRFSRYSLIFRIAETPLAPVLLSAETRAEFPGRTGSAYRAAIVGTRAHALVVSSILRAVRRQAERAARRRGTPV